MKNIFLATVTSGLLCATSVCWANHYNVDIQGEYESWRSGLGGQSTALLAGLGVGYHGPKFFSGVGFVTGDYDTEDNSDDTLQRTDVDLVIGYRLDQRLSIFAGYRFNQMKYNSDTSGAKSFDENAHGLGGGVSFSAFIHDKWILFGSAALSFFTTKTQYDDDTENDSGNGYSLGTEGGVLFRMSQKTSIALRLKYQTSEVNYDNGNWPNAYQRLGLQLSQAF